MFFRKLFLPWTVSDQFSSAGDYQAWLNIRHKELTDLRIFFLIPSAICLLVGYCMDLRPVMVLTVVPLALVLLISIMLEKTEAVMDGQDNPSKQGDESNMKYVCDLGGWEYDEEEGYPEGGIAPGTSWEDVPEDFECPLCSVGKDQFSEA